MFFTLTDASKGKPYSLSESIERCKEIGIRSLSMWIGWYNIYEEHIWRCARDDVPRLNTEIKIQPGLYNFLDLVDMLTSQFEGFTITVNS